VVRLIRGKYNGLAIARHGLLFPDTIRKKVIRKQVDVSFTLFLVSVLFINNIYYARLSNIFWKRVSRLIYI